MESRSLSGVLTAEAKDNVNPPHAYASSAGTEGTPASRLLRKLYCESSPTPRRSPKKTDRVLMDKGVGPEKMRRPVRRATTPETPTRRPSKLADRTLTSIPIVDCTPAAKQDSRLSMASSQTTYYDGDEEFEEIVAQMDDQTVEKLLDPSVDNSRTEDSGSGGTSLRSTKSEPTTLESPSSEASRKRKDAPADDYPHRRAKPSSEQRNTSRSSKSSSKDSDRKAPVHPSPVAPLTASAAHQRSLKQDRPIPRHMRDLGHGVAQASTSMVAASATKSVVSSDPSAASPSLFSPIKRVVAATLGNSPREDHTDQTPAEVFAKASPAPSLSSPITTISTRLSAVTPARQARARLNRTTKEVPSTEQNPETSPIIIAHNEMKQQLLDNSSIAKGVQYEIARGITNGWWSWEDITDGVVSQLRGTNFEMAGKVAEVIGKGPTERLSPATISTRQAIYAELDREQAAFLENKGRGLGLKGPWKGKENWHGGCVQLTCKLEFSKDVGKDGPPFVIRLNPFGTGKSNRAARRVTSLSILQLKIEKGALYDEKKYELVTEHLSRHVVICGRRYCAFCTKEGKVFFVETKDDFERTPRRSVGDQYRMSFRRFMNLFNPPELNKEQVLNKWLARCQLILSTSRPVIEFEPENIYLDVEDIYGEEGDKDSMMTDGCGWINLSALRLIKDITNCPSVPVGIQGRIGGAKGLWVLHPAQEHRSDTEPPKIWIRRSQLKVKLLPKEKWDPSLRVFDLVRLPRLTVPSGLNAQTILNMSNNGIKDKVFADLMEAGLKQEIEPLTKWEGDNSCMLLARAVEQAGGIMASRRSRGAGSEARLYNYARDESDEDDGAEANAGLVERDPVSSCPSSLYESARDMLLAGFSPLENVVLREKLRHILSQTIKSYLEKFHIPILSSAEAFIAPDPYGVLEEGEIYFKSSVSFGDPNICIDPCTILGPVLVSRNPTRLPSDVRKVTAVSRDQLLSYTDVIIFSTKGKRSLASYLGGGDYDGDTVTIIAEPSLVNEFENSDHFPEPQEVREAFEEKVEKVSEFLVKLGGIGRQELSYKVAKQVLGGLSDGKVGRYSHFHDNATYELGYNRPETIRLAYMFTTCLDSVKSGLRIKSATFKIDSKRWNVARPECMQKADESSRNQFRDVVDRRLNRPRSLGPFVLDTLKTCAKELGDRALCEFEKLSEKGESSVPWSKPDDDLARPYNDMKESAIRLRDECGCTFLLDDLEKIENFVRPVCEEYIAQTGAIFGERSPRKGGVADSKSKSVTSINHEFSRRFEEGLSDYHFYLPLHLVRDLKASYAHIYGTSKAKMGKGFGFAVAHDTFCALKTKQRGGASIGRESRDYVLVSSNLAKLVSYD